VRAAEALRPLMVHVFSHSRHRQNVVIVMTLARVSMPLPLQNGHIVGRGTDWSKGGLYVIAPCPRGAREESSEWASPALMLTPLSTGTLFKIEQRWTARRITSPSLPLTN
jgi:hypothetical protein